MTNRPNLDPGTIYNFFCVDFESAWDALAATSPDVVTGRGNFMFARSAMGLLEFTSRLCASDQQALDDFSEELAIVDARYFASLPAAGPRPGMRKGKVEWTLPNAGNPEQELLGALFTLVRHGQAHQGQQTMATLDDGGVFGISVSGVQDRTIADVRASPRSAWHLRVNSLHAGRTWIQLQPECLYLDIRAAAESARLLDRGLDFEYLSQTYAFGTEALRDALAAAGLRKVNEAP